ncbi:MAG TPA: host attachment protein [Betaproteobacteria bacterium]|nr:host attachment protein [Betaproteobacteria bacterium]
MSTTWILIANASGARLFTNRGPQKGLELLKTFDHPESREKAAELVTDRPGHNKSAGNGHGAYVPATDPKYHAAEGFAQQLAKELEQGRIANGYDQLIVAAAPSNHYPNKHKGRNVPINSVTVDRHSDSFLKNRQIVG